MRCIDWFMVGLAVAAALILVFMWLREDHERQYGSRRSRKHKDSSCMWVKDDIEMFLYDKDPAQQSRLDAVRKNTARIMANYQDACTSFFSTYSPSSITEHAPATPELPHV